MWKSARCSVSVRYIISMTRLDYDLCYPSNLCATFASGSPAKKNLSNHYPYRLIGHSFHCYSSGLNIWLKWLPSLAKILLSHQPTNASDQCSGLMAMQYVNLLRAPYDNLWYGLKPGLRTSQKGARRSASKLFPIRFALKFAMGAIARSECSGASRMIITELRTTVSWKRSRPLLQSLFFITA